MRILMVGALSWNPERVRSLCEQGHELWGTWARSMAWDQGPYPVVEDCVHAVAIEDAPQVISEQHIDCVYALFQVYRPVLWGPATAGIEHDVWTLLRELYAARARGAFDVPIVFHWGFDVHHFDEDVVRALDGQIFCNREQHTYWTTPVADGGAGLDIFDDCPIVDFLDSDRPKAEFMNDDSAPRLSAQRGDVHTVCIGRPFNIDYVAMAQNGIHLHVYGNGVDDALQLVARGVLANGGSRDVDLIREFVHFHSSRQPTGRSWPEVREWKSRWVSEFSRYDAGWSCIAAPYAWSPLEDAAAIPNRLSTYLLAGLPVIADPRPGFYRYNELTRLGVNLDLTDSDYRALRAEIQNEAKSGARRRAAVAARANYSFDATIEPLLAILQRARDAYFATPLAQRRRPLPHTRHRPTVDTSLAGERPRPGLLRRGRHAVARRLRDAQQERVVRRLQP